MYKKKKLGIKYLDSFDNIWKDLDGQIIGWLSHSDFRLFNGMMNEYCRVIKDLFIRFLYINSNIL